MTTEFEIIENYFHRPTHRSDICLSIGDDAAILELESNKQWVTSIDTLNQGIHFPENTAAFDIGYKSLAVSLSDMAAMGAKPKTVLLSLSLPTADEAWLDDFSRGFFTLAEEFQVMLVGGDTCRGPLAVSTVVNGVVARDKFLTRSNAQSGDGIFVTGTLGDAGLALRLLLQNEKQLIEEALLQRLNRPTPRIAAGLGLVGLATSAMDISDGLVIDLMRLCQSSRVGAVVYAERLPLSSLITQRCTLSEAWQLALCAGDDYELLFTLPLAKLAEVADLGCKITQIGEVVAAPGVQVLDPKQQEIKLTAYGYDHFLKE